MPERQAAVHTERAAGWFRRCRDSGREYREAALETFSTMCHPTQLREPLPDSGLELELARVVSSRSFVSTCPISLPYARWTPTPAARRAASSGPATRAAVRQLAVNDHGGDAADAVLLRLRGPRTLAHVHHLHVTRRTRDSVHERDRLLTGGAPGTENLDLPLGSHVTTPLAL